jgi:glycosyltransferase involved in cell wall biosynthesis
MPKLSILIPYLERRDSITLKALVDEIQNQCEIFKEVDLILLGDNGEQTTGAKRNRLLEFVETPYIWFVDADDMILPGAIQAILKALKSEPDCVAINGYMTTNGKNRVDWFIARDNPYEAAKRDGKEVYLRWTNHITPIKTEIAWQIKFPDKSQREDYEWSVALKKSGLLKTEVEVKIPVYHYQFLTKRK